MSMNFLSSGGGGGSAVPYKRITEPSQLGMFLALEQAEMIRLRRYHEHWNFYMGRQWAFSREGGEALVTMNYTKRVIDKSVSWLVGQGFTLRVPDVFKRHTLPALQEVHQYNDLITLEEGVAKAGRALYDIGTTGSVSGDVFILVSYAEPTAQARRVNPHTKGQIRVHLLNSDQVFPQWDPLNINVLTAVRIETIYYDDPSTTDQDYDHQGRQLNTRRFSQTITPTHIIEQYQGQNPIVKANPLGEIPLVHIKNQSLPGEYYGIADMDGLIDIQREMNEKATDVSDVINYQTAPITWITGAKVKNLERSPRNIWSGLPADARVGQLSLDSGSLSAANDYRADIKKAFLEIAETPEGSLGMAQPVSNTSGVALHTQYQALIEKTDRKKANYEPGLAQVNYFILRHLELVDPSFRLPTDMCSSCGGRIVEFMSTDEACPYCAGKGEVVLTPEQKSMSGTDEDKVKCTCVTTTKKCYRVNEQTFDFLAPEEVEVRYVRQHSFGNKIEEAPFEQVEKEHQEHAPSFWDMEPQKPAEDKAAELHEEMVKQTPESPPERGPEGQQLPALKTKKPPAPKPEPPQMPVSAVEMPPEPEEITLRRVMLDPLTGDERELDSVKLMVVPTNCKDHINANPYEAKVSFNESLPKDLQLQANLYQTYEMNQWVDKDWVRRHISEIAPEAERIEKRLEKERAKAQQQPAPTGGAAGGTADQKPTGQGQGASGDEDQRAQQPGGTNKQPV